LQRLNNGDQNEITYNYRHKLFKGSKKHILSRKLKTTCIVSAIVFFIFAIIPFAVKVYFQAVIILVIAFVLFFEMMFFENLLVKKNLKNIRELYGTEKVDGTVEFLDDKMIISNSATNGTLPINYRIISRVVETSNYFTMFTKQNSMIIMDKSSMSTDETSDFLNIVKTKMIKAKYVKGK